MSVGRERQTEQDRVSDVDDAARESRRAKHECLAACAVIFLSVTLPLPDLSGHILHLPSICPFYYLTGLPCPGCGLTRAFVLIGHGDLRQSLALHPLGWLAYTAFLTVFIDGAPMLIGLRDRALLPRSARSRILWFCLLATLAAGLLRLAEYVMGWRHNF
ncbi:MAG: DUF2752 domain-containing protein [Capsulimonas sp.]|uniref:DUF2752 domain-containing protein n=1 Tax=Capsulimonas sp. TaxID=2494211 RepID=UPI00326604D7